MTRQSRRRSLLVLLLRGPPVVSSFRYKHVATTRRSSCCSTSHAPSPPVVIHPCALWKSGREKFQIPSHKLSFFLANHVRPTRRQSKAAQGTTMLQSDSRDNLADVLLLGTQEGPESGRRRRRCFQGSYSKISMPRHVELTSGRTQRQSKRKTPKSWPRQRSEQKREVLWEPDSRNLANEPNCIVMTTVLNTP